MQGKLSCPFQKQWNKANNGGRCGVFCLPCVLQTLQQLSPAVPAHGKLQARSWSCSAAVLQGWWRCCEGSHHHNIQDFPRLAPPPALHSAGHRVGVESGFYKVAVACLFTFTGCLHGCRFTHLLPQFWNIFILRVFGNASLQSRNVVVYSRWYGVVAAGWGVWVSLWQHNRDHNNLHPAHLIATTSHIIQPSLYILSRRNVYTRAQNRLIWDDSHDRDMIGGQQCGSRIKGNQGDGRQGMGLGSGSQGCWWCTGGSYSCSSTNIKPDLLI